jgi:hypothetical protein
MSVKKKAELKIKFRKELKSGYFFHLFHLNQLLKKPLDSDFLADCIS